MTMCNSACEYSACVHVLTSEKVGEAGDSSSPRQGCQLTKAAQHASVCLGERGPLKSPCPAGVSMKVSITPPLQALNNGILNMHTFKGDWPPPPGG